MLFRDEFYFLSNMYPVPVTVNINGKDMTFDCSEAAFQAGKCAERAGEFLGIDGYAAKSLGRKVKIITGWNVIKLEWMYRVLVAKFTQNKELGDKLVATGTMELVEDNTWRDTYWGRYEGQGENHMGKLLMRVRVMLRRKMNQEKIRDTWDRIMEMLPHEPRTEDADDPGFWVDGNRILCPSEAKAVTLYEFMDDVFSEWGSYDLNMGQYGNNGFWYLELETPEGGSGDA